MGAYGQLKSGSRDGAGCAKAMVVGDGSRFGPENPYGETIIQSASITGLLALFFCAGARPLADAAGIRRHNTDQH